MCPGEFTYFVHLTFILSATQGFKHALHNNDPCAENKHEVNRQCFYIISATVVVTLIFFCNMLFQWSTSTF